MIDRNQLPFLVRLLDDETAEVRSAVVTAFEEFGPNLDGELAKLGIFLTREQSVPIQHILDRARTKQLMSSWHEWYAIGDDKERLETALRMIVDLQDGALAGQTLSPLLDQLALEYRKSVPTPDALGLANFLFREKNLQGVGQSDYLNPLNSNLVYVLEEKRGLPISLTCVFILVGHRLGLGIEGCNFPGHFLAVVPWRMKKVLVDCYNGGRTIDESDLANIDARVRMRDLLRLECESTAIIVRVLRNLKNAYEHTGHKTHVRLMDHLLGEMIDSEAQLL